MESPLLGLILDSSVIIAAERKRQTVEEFLTAIGRIFGEVEIAMSAITLSELVTEWRAPTRLRSEPHDALLSMN